MCTTVMTSLYLKRKGCTYHFLDVHCQPRDSHCQNWLLPEILNIMDLLCFYFPLHASVHQCIFASTSTKPKRAVQMACLFIHCRFAARGAFSRLNPFKWECTHSFAPTVSSCVVILSVTFTNWQKSSREHLIHQWLICNKLFIAKYLIYAHI